MTQMTKHEWMRRFRQELIKHNIDSILVNALMTLSPYESLAVKFQDQPEDAARDVIVNMVEAGRSKRLAIDLLVFTSCLVGFLCVNLYFDFWSPLATLLLAVVGLCTGVWGVTKVREWQRLFGRNLRRIGG